MLTQNLCVKSWKKGNILDQNGCKTRLSNSMGQNPLNTGAGRHTMTISLWLPPYRFVQPHEVEPM